MMKLIFAQVFLHFSRVLSWFFSESEVGNGAHIISGVVWYLARGRSHVLSGPSSLICSAFAEILSFKNGSSSLHLLHHCCVFPCYHHWGLTSSVFCPISNLLLSVGNAFNCSNTTFECRQLCGVFAGSLPRQCKPLLLCPPVMLGTGNPGFWLPLKALSTNARQKSPQNC